MDEYGHGDGNTVIMLCQKCGRTFDVELQGEHIWRVAPDPMSQIMVTEFRDDSIVRAPIDFYSAPQIQASVFPLCTNPVCLGILTDEPIVVGWRD